MVPKQSLPSTDKQEAAPSEMDADALRALVERLFQENHSLQLQVVELKDNSSSDIRAKLAELEQQNLTLTQELTSALASKGELEQQNLTLSQDLASARISKASAEKDSEFLRTQYTTASGYASEVGAENASLQQRVEIAERQAAEGVALIKASFEERLRVSEEQTRSFAKIADFMMKKDTATDNIRQQAAEAPELKARCEKLEEQIQRLEGEIEIEQLKVEALEQEKEAIEMELKEVVDKGKGDSAESRRQIAQLMVDLNETKAAQHQNASSERVFRCEWRLADSSPCMFICPTVKVCVLHSVVLTPY
ncbi:hypothetical protein BDP27DRAFT_856351 [Rhodocollybia butyracea]|uniref:Uncharacterized protein n=1 Tax=Rhodocollybia butyracea TaxID=206335 RepID=A0A9P5PR70_9AGAR|nr:hypothetical protein BDP27DRAFT_856351 [Rhodocollybia butyracea]